MAALRGPRLTSASRTFGQIQRSTLMLLRLFVMIDPYPRHQLFVQQCLTAFLKALKQPSSDVEFE